MINDPATKNTSRPSGLAALGLTTPATEVTVVKILFANLYQPGITYAITGPWRPQR